MPNCPCLIPHSQTWLLHQLAYEVTKATVRQKTMGESMSRILYPIDQARYDLDEKIMTDGWITTNFYAKNSQSIPDEPGIYLISWSDMSSLRESFIKPIITYVGKSTNLSKRLEYHPIISQLYNDFEPGFAPSTYFMRFSREEISKRERFYIKKYNPLYNKQLKTRKIKGTQNV